MNAQKNIINCSSQFGCDVRIFAKIDNNNYWGRRDDNALRDYNISFLRFDGGLTNDIHNHLMSLPTMTEEQAEAHSLTLS